MDTPTDFNHTACGDSSVETAEFLRAITRCSPDQWVELRFMRSDRVLRRHYRRDDPKLVQAVREATRLGFNVYFGVAPRTEHGKGDRAHCAGLSTLFCDIDFKLTPPGVAAKTLNDFPLRPSALVQTGGGWHPYWSLDGTLLFPENFDCARSLLRRLCLAIGADLAAAEPVRILRAPDSRNFKYDPPREVRILDFDPSLRYSVDDFEDTLRDVKDDRDVRAIEWKEPPPLDPNSTRPGDLFNARASWPALLEPHGWRVAHTCGPTAYWTRPGKRDGISGSTNYDGHDVFWVFTSSASPFEAGRGYTKFSIFALLEHRGDFAAAARELAGR